MAFGIDDLLGIGSMGMGIAQMFSKPKEDPEIAANRINQRNLAAITAAGVRPSATTDLINTATHGMNEQTRRATEGYGENLRTTGNYTPGAYARGATELRKEGLGKAGDIISQYKGQAALQAPENAARAAGIISGLPGFTPSGSQMMKQNQMNSFIGGLSGMRSMNMFKDTNASINEMYKAAAERMKNERFGNVPTSAMPMAGINPSLMQGWGNRIYNPAMALEPPMQPNFDYSGGLF